MWRMDELMADVRLAELLTALSLVTDLGMGHPPEEAVIANRVGGAVRVRRQGLPNRRRVPRRVQRPFRAPRRSAQPCVCALAIRAARSSSSCGSLSCFA